MPIYEYQCQNCDHYMEAMQRMVDEPLTDCPVCAKPALKKLISAAAFRLSGSGWYETDFKTGKKKNVVGGVSEKKPEATAKPSGSADSSNSSSSNAPSSAGASAP